MHSEVIRDDNENPLGILLQQNQDGENPVLSRFMKEGMTPVSFTPQDGLLVAFGRPRETSTDDETEEEEPPTQANLWVG
jgi:hypothetical protein